VLPTAKERKAAKKRNEYQFGYGGGKLACEQALLSACTGPYKLPAVILRLSDVMGPYDNLGSHLEIQRAVQAGEPVPVGLLEEHGIADPFSHRVSIVYAPDVISAVQSAADSDAGSVVGKIFHLASRETPTVPEYVAMVSLALDTLGGGDSVVERPVQFDVDKEASFPSVDVGPICISASLAQLPGWEPTPMQEWVQSTVEWNMDEGNQAYSDLMDTL
jgi:nucleoside-diphosphate-sugar epimerase